MRTCAYTTPGILSGIGRRGIYGFLLVFAISASTCFAETVGPQLTLDPVNVKQEGSVSFSVLSVGIETRSDFPGPRFVPAQTEDGAFRLYMDVDSIQQVRFNEFTFTAYLVDVKAGGPRSTKVQITGNPNGLFRDAPVRVTFRVKGAASSVTGVIVMPVYNATKADLLLVDEQKEPAYVSISGSSNATLPIDLLPNSIPALTQGALMIKPDVPHDTLTLSVTYHTVPGGADKKQSVPLKIRFGPGLLGLALALCGGIALGLTARYLLTGNLGKDDERALHAILSAFVLGLIAEVIGVMMTAYGNSKLVLFDLDIDPRQLFPAFILAVLVSGGSAVVTWMKSMFGKTS